MTLFADMCGKLYTQFDLLTWIGSIEEGGPEYSFNGIAQILQVNPDYKASQTAAVVINPNRVSRNQPFLPTPVLSAMLEAQGPLVLQMNKARPAISGLWEMEGDMSEKAQKVLTALWSDSAMTITTQSTPVVLTWRITWTLSSMIHGQQFDTDNHNVITGADS
ncbi:hypothetical protein DPV78_008537 [Talaromyces pinophilus]|nr:hypothetical protein DPV78_008537 [Talaromyces pinophilus]